MQLLLGCPKGEDAIARAVAQGLARIADAPEREGDGWIVRCWVTDTDSFKTEEVKRGPWQSKSHAMDWITSILVGGYAPKQRAHRGRTAATTGRSEDDGDAVPGAMQVQDFEAASGRNGAPRKRIRIGTVRDALEEAGLDPSRELAAILMKRRPMFAKNGMPLRDPETGELMTEPVLPAATAAALLSDLQQYITPKLKAIETIVRDADPKTPEEVNAAIDKLLAKREQLERGAVR